MAGEQQRRDAAEMVWLGYFNRTLYERGVITQGEYRRLTLSIQRRRRPPDGAG